MFVWLQYDAWIAETLVVDGSATVPRSARKGHSVFASGFVTNVKMGLMNCPRSSGVAAPTAPAPVADRTDGLPGTPVEAAPVLIPYERRIMKIVRAVVHATMIKTTVYNVCLFFVEATDELVSAGCTCKAG